MKLHIASKPGWPELVDALDKIVVGDNIWFDSAPGSISVKCLEFKQTLRNG
jgi:hypothetical protein